MLLVGIIKCSAHWMSVSSRVMLNSDSKLLDEVHFARECNERVVLDYVIDVCNCEVGGYIFVVEVYFHQLRN